MLNVTSPPNSIHYWNAHKSKNIEALVEFAFVYLIIDGPLLLYVPKKTNVRDNVRILWALMVLYFGRIGGVLASCHCALQWTHL